jgi:putative ABC transport system permease protein
VRENPFGRLLAGFVGSVVEAWSEFRVHKTRVLLSLVGVGIAVTALTTVVAGGAIATQALTESFERGSGRPATLYVSAYNPRSGEQPSPDDMTAAFLGAMERYDIAYFSRTTWGALRVQFADGVADMSAQGVDAPFGAMHRIEVEHGSWFTPYDEQRLAPAIVVSEEVWNRLGAPDLRTHPTLEIVGGSQNTIAVIVGVTPAQSTDGSYLQAYLLNDAFTALVPANPDFPNMPNYEAWVPPDLASELVPLLQRDIAGSLGEDWQVQVNRQDYLAWNGEDPLFVLKIAVIGIALLVLALGALGLVNIALVTVRHRIREIGIRRSFGATAGRVFVSVMMESVVATLAAGVVGVLVSVLLVKNPLTESIIAQQVEDVPAFPLDAALIGLGAATLVGALAGLLPALVAVRVKVIDAIRY